ncbi:MAG: hypothetical protein P4L82_07470 [Ancalomicrobiaceae bacterium]|nr:hypothetical protein [Ancalomicrobiaceae bacterium]
MNQTLQIPVAYSSALEHPEVDEAKTIQLLQQTLMDIIETTSKHAGHGYRAVHAKSHALLEGTLTVAGNLPPALAQGLFAKPGAYKTFIGFRRSPATFLTTR